MIARIVVPLVLGVACVACGAREDDGAPTRSASAPAAARADTPAPTPDAVPGNRSADLAPPMDTSTARVARPTVLFIGTSLTAGLGLDPSHAYPALLQQNIDSAGLDYAVVNAGVSGETSAGALRRTDWLFRRPPAVVVIETGANDGLRGQSPDSIAANIQAIIDRARALRPAPRIVLVGMEAMPNLGADYARRFHAVYPRLARQNHVPLVPFLLDGVAGIDSLNQPDGLHPTAAGQRRLAANVWRVLEPVLRQAARTGTGAA
jgi:acyl-CoA thioesterase I